MPKRIGELNHCIELLKQINEPVDNPSGEDEEFYQVIIDDEYAATDVISAGARYLTTRNTDEAATHRFWIYFDGDIADRGIIDHLTFDGRMFEIQNIVLDNEDIAFLILEVRELGRIVDPDANNTYDIRPIAP